MFSRSHLPFPPALVPVLVLAVALAVWSMLLGRREKSIILEIHQLEQELATRALHLAEADRLRPRFQGILDKATRLAAGQTDDSWMPALRSIAVSTGPDIELRTIHVWNDPDGAPRRVLRLEGVATGTAPRSNADRFFQSLRRELERSFPSAKPIRLERLEDRPPAPQDNFPHPGATFTITAPLPAAPDAP